MRKHFRNAHHFINFTSSTLLLAMKGRFCCCFGIAEMVAMLLKKRWVVFGRVEIDVDDDEIVIDDDVSDI